MPLVQDDPETDLNSFIDMAVIKDDDHHPIVKASRNQNSNRKLRPRQLNFGETNWRSSRPGPAKSVCSEPALGVSSSSRQLSNNEEAINPSSSVRGLFQTGEFQSVELESSDDGEDDDDVSVSSQGAVLVRPDSFTRAGSSSRLAAGGESSKQQHLGSSSSSRRTLGSQAVEVAADRIAALEQDMAKLNFELAEARGQVDWHKMQHRQLHVEFEDLQAFSKQLQTENAELKEGIVPNRKKRGPAWFKPGRIRQLNQPRRRKEFEEDKAGSQTSMPFPDESSRSRQHHHSSNEDWDDDTLTTNFGGASHVEGETSSHGRKGPLVTFMDQEGKQQRSEELKCSSLDTNDTPKDITVTNQKVTTEERVQNMVKMLEGDAAGFDDSANAATAQTELVDYRNQVEETDDYPNIPEEVKEEEVEEEAQVEKKVERKNGLFSRFNQKTANIRNSLAVKRNEEDGEQSVGTINTAQTTKTMPTLGWNLQGRRSSFVAKHRFQPAHRGSVTETNISSSSYANSEMHELDLQNSAHASEDTRNAEVYVHQDTVEQLKDQPARNGDKPWWAKVQKNLPKLNKPFQNMQQQKREWRVENNVSRVVPVEEQEDQEAWDQIGQELLPFERSSHGSDDDMPSDLSGPTVPSTLHDYLPNYFQDNSDRMDSSSSGSSGMEADFPY